MPSISWTVISASNGAENRAMGQSQSHEQETLDSRVVQTKYGSIIGRRFIFEDQQVDAFQGVPYAKPPIGDLRFRKPEPPELWEGVRETKAFAARSIQKESIYGKKMAVRTSEDCLYLNVFTPVWSPTSATGFAVLAFIHGGGFVSDSTVKYGDVGICKHLCTKDVVVVTLQYRVGFLGFFSTGDEHCRGNFGLWDQTLALKWIQENISFFNGDPNNVTVMGQSAGAASGDLLSICPHSRDLFHRSIIMGGNASCEWAMDGDMVEKCRKFAEKNGAKNHRQSALMIDFLRGIPASRFALALLSSEKLDELRCRVGPRIDGDFIPKTVSELRKEAPGKPMLIGCCSSEGLIMADENATSVSAVMEKIARIFPEDDYPIIFKQLRDEVFAKLLVDVDDPAAVARANVEVLSDTFTNIGVQRSVLETLAAQNEPVYFYSFDYYNPNSWGPYSAHWPLKDATHCTELSYIFAVGIISDFEFTKDDLKMLELTTRLWTNFAKYGNPNGASDDAASPPPQLCEVPFTWEPTTTSNPQKHLSLKLHPEMSKEFKNGRPLFIIQMQEKRKARTEM